MDWPEDREHTSLKMAMKQANDEAEKDREKPWRFSGDRCPKCGGPMIINRSGLECGSMHCAEGEKGDE